MAAKITLQDLAALLAERQKITLSEATTFARAFFDLIASGVESDNMVKVKGLGTFKFIDVADRESINVSTGERIVIPGHSKVSFTPDAALRDQVNKPFADFQTVILNESTPLGQMEQLHPFAETQPTAEVNDAPETPETPQPAEEAPAEESLSEQAIPEVHDEPAAESSAESPQPDPHPRGRLLVWLLLLGLLLIALSYFAGSRGCFQRSDESPAAVQPVEEAPQPLSHADSLALKQKELLQRAAQYPQVPDSAYLIVGTRRVHKMQRGEGLIHLSQDEYGDKEFARYVILYNQFANPNVIPVGTEVKFPELVENPNPPIQQ